jgi:hypothetical protein
MLATAGMLATARIIAARTPALSKGHKQETAQPQQQKTPATAGSVWKRSGSECLQGSSNTEHNRFSDARIWFVLKLVSGTKNGKP